jgi:hypothetical protein
VTIPLDRVNPNYRLFDSELGAPGQPELPGLAAAKEPAKPEPAADEAPFQPPPPTIPPVTAPMPNRPKPVLPPIGTRTIAAPR